MRLTVRSAEEGDYELISELFCCSVREVCSEDYPPSAIAAWLKGNESGEVWKRKLEGHIVLLSFFDEALAGFGDITLSGCLDHLFVHPEFLGMGIGTLLSDSLERCVKAEVITVEASLSAHSFFRKRGYEDIRRQQVERNGVLLENFLMEKKLS